MLRGALAAAVTPLAGDRLDEDAFGPYVDFLAAAGVDGLLALGTTGEGLLFDPDERRRALELFVEASAGRLQVAAHCGAQTTAEQAALLEHLGQIDKRFVAIVIGSENSISGAKTIADQDGEIARIFAAEPGAIYLLRPDLHIAGRWKAAVPSEILKTAEICLGGETP